MLSSIVPAGSMLENEYLGSSSVTAGPLTTQVGQQDGQDVELESSCFIERQEKWMRESVRFVRGSDSVCPLAVLKVIATSNRKVTWQFFTACLPMENLFVHPFRQSLRCATRKATRHLVVPSRLNSTATGAGKQNLSWPEYLAIRRGKRQWEMVSICRIGQ
jgi:hypothetical protein